MNIVKRPTTVIFVAVFFFFQAEDGIRDKLVTGVQTCALPISEALLALQQRVARPHELGGAFLDARLELIVRGAQRSEEHTSELQSLAYLVCRLLLEKKKQSSPRAPNTTHAGRTEMASM